MCMNQEADVKKMKEGLLKIGACLECQIPEAALITGLFAAISMERVRRNKDFLMLYLLRSELPPNPH